MYISGLGIVFSGGRGIPDFKKAISQGWEKSGQLKNVAKEIISDKIVLKEARRADDFTKIAVLAAVDAFVDSGLGEDAKESLGIILATALGPHVTTFKFLNDILTYGDNGVSPTLFSHSVHNAAVSYIAANLGSHGPTLTVTQFADSFSQALFIAQSWLAEKRCTNILVGSVDQLGKEMDYILTAKAPQLLPREGSVFFLLTETEKTGKYSSIFADLHAKISLNGFSCAAKALQ
jgi:3-oxoacyl-[acyl-carrier-protein] synthase II